MKKQTAVEWLAEQMMHPSIHNPYIEQAKEIEKQQIIDAHVVGHNAPSSTIKNWDAEQYYNETFKNTNK
jgi:hypothetical protein